MADDDPSPETTGDALRDAYNELLARYAAMGRRIRRRSLILLDVCCLVLVPWIIYLALSLPPRYQAGHWRWAWVGFDILLLLGLVSTAYLGWRRRQAMIVAAVFTGTMLVCDAWFDMLLARNTHDLLLSVASAVFIELPLAALLFWRARRVLMISITIMWAKAGLEGEPPPFRKLPMFGGLAPDLAKQRVGSRAP